MVDLSRHLSADDKKVVQNPDDIRFIDWIKIVANRECRKLGKTANLTEGDIRVAWELVKGAEKSTSATVLPASSGKKGKRRRRKPTTDEKGTPCVCCTFPLTERTHFVFAHSDRGENELTVQLCPNCHAIYHYILKLSFTTMDTKEVSAEWPKIPSDKLHQRLEPHALRRRIDIAEDSATIVNSIVAGFITHNPCDFANIVQLMEIGLNIQSSEFHDEDLLDSDDLPDDDFVLLRLSLTPDRAVQVRKP